MSVDAQSMMKRAARRRKVQSAKHVVELQFEVAVVVRGVVVCFCFKMRQYNGPLLKVVRKSIILHGKIGYYGVFSTLGFLFKRFINLFLEELYGGWSWEGSTIPILMLVCLLTLVRSSCLRSHWTGVREISTNRSYLIFR